MTSPDDPTGVCVLPGRFQPFHNGHAAVLEHAAATHTRVVVAISNAHISHTASDPFTGGERLQMIDLHCRTIGIIEQVVTLPIPVDDEPTTWVATIKAVSPPFDSVYTRSAWTSSLFAYWGIPTVTDVLNGHTISATTVRELIATGGQWTEHVPPATAHVLRSIGGLDRVRQLSLGKNHRAANIEATEGKGHTS